MANICYKKKEFCICFKISKDVLFTVDYYRCSSNKEPYFSTVANVFYPNHEGPPAEASARKPRSPSPTTRPRPTVADAPS